ncbi:hypothetical protein MMYC01_208605 [Madurella mycetomatis]|uniref:Uncharacterized protein n=1 Tax=Madurella mycetomatis TaxID=100816 RepID=A0A175VT13_9PEZI|nr:hypothetical protein MMYC01_208605 [Madurella mycetomatis]
MDHDQFGGRTDDDLFSDDIEPVDEFSSLSTAVQTVSEGVPSQPEPAPPAPAQPQEPTAAPPSQAPRSSLAQSRHAPRQQDKPRHPQNSKPPQKPPAATDTPAVQEPPASTASSGTSTPPAPTGLSTSSNNNTNHNKPPSNAPREPSSKNTASAVSAARLNSGANPRTKLTEEELAARMEKMRLLAAEKTRRFEEAQRDETEHAAALARGLEEARKRRAEDAARRKAAEEERRRLEEERAKNRERKLAAMGMKEGGWDEGKEERDDRGLGAFRGAFGGVRGNRSSQGPGLGGSRFASSDGREEYNGFGGGGGVVEGGAAGADGVEGVGASSTKMRTGGPAQLAPKKADLKGEDFPALPSLTGAAPKKLDTTWGAKSNNPVADIPLSPPVGKWDEEVAAMDNKTSTS